MGMADELEPGTQFIGRFYMATASQFFTVGTDRSGWKYAYRTEDNYRRSADDVIVFKVLGTTVPRIIAHTGGSGFEFVD